MTPTSRCSNALIVLAPLLALAAVACSPKECDEYDLFLPDPICDEDESIEPGEDPEPHRSVSLRISVQGAEEWVGETLVARLEDELTGETLRQRVFDLGEASADFSVVTTVEAERTVRLAGHVTVDLDRNGACDPDEPSWHAVAEAGASRVTVSAPGSEAEPGCE